MDQTNCSALIRYKDHEIRLDTSLLGSMVPLRLGSVYMLIGEIISGKVPSIWVSIAAHFLLYACIRAGRTIPSTAQSLT